MDRTAEFRKLVGEGSDASHKEGAWCISRFMSAAMEQTQRLEELNTSFSRGGDRMASIQECQNHMAEVEGFSDDFTTAEGSELPVLKGRKKQDKSLDTMRAHRQAVVASLYEKLRELAAKVQSEQVNELQREQEVNSFFSSAPVRGLQPSKPPASKRSQPRGSGQEPWAQDGPGLPSDDQLRAESQALLTNYKSDLDQIQGTQAKLEELSSLVGLFANKVAEQAPEIEMIYEDAQKATDHVERGEEYLKKAVTNQNGYRFYVCCWFVGSALTLLLIDFIDARYSWI